MHNQNFKKRGKENSGKRRNFSSAREKKTMYKAKCSVCTNNCEVPFKPNGKKPVLCSHCFGKTDASQKFDSPAARRINESGRETFSAVCDNCGKSCGVPFKPNGKKPVLCSLCFAQDNSIGSDGRNGRKDYKPKNNQLDIINNKLDEILKTLSRL